MSKKSPETHLKAFIKYSIDDTTGVQFRSRLCLDMEDVQVIEEYVAAEIKPDPVSPLCIIKLYDGDYHIVACDFHTLMAFLKKVRTLTAKKYISAIQN